MAPIRSDDHMDWLPGLGNIHQGRSNSGFASRAELETALNTQAADSRVDEVQYSIVCDDCGKHFWSRSKADSHAALTTHVLHEEIISPCPTMTIPESPAATSASAPDTATLFTCAKQAVSSINTETPDEKDSKDSEDEEHSLCFGCGRHFWSHEAADDHAKTAHLQDTDMVPSIAPDRSSNFGAADPTATPKYSAASPSVISSSLYWNTSPGTASLAGNGAINPTSPNWTMKQIFHPAISPTSPLYKGGVSPTSVKGTTCPTSGHAMDLFRGPVSRPGLLNPDSQSSHSESDDDRRRSSGVSPSPSTFGLPSYQDLPRSANTGTQTAVTPNTTAPSSPSSSCATVENTQVIFPRELSDRIFFIVTPSGSRTGPGFIMGLPEAQNAVTFRTGVRARLQSQGEQVGMREIIARIPWLTVPVYADTDEDHYHMLMVVRFWPEWQKTNGKASCHIYVTLEDAKEDK